MRTGLRNPDVVTTPSADEAARALGVVVPVNTAGAAPALLAEPDSAWFRALEKPIPHPPPAIFGVVRTAFDASGNERRARPGATKGSARTALFALTGIALGLVRRSNADGRRTAPALSVLQRASTSRGRPPPSPGGPLVEPDVIVALWALVAGTIAAFDRVGRGAAALLVPTSCGVVFAALNYRLWRPNGHELPPGIISFRR